MPLTKTFQKQVDRVATMSPQAQLAVATAVKTVLDDFAAVVKAGRKGRTRTTVRGVKAKGREGVLAVRAWLLEMYPALDEDDIVVQTTSVGGSDLQLSPVARAFFPFGIESKNVQSLNVWKALKQADLNARKKGLRPVLFFRRNNSDLHIALSAADFMAWLRTKGL